MSAQLDWLAKEHVRRRDPDTSRAAARSVEKSSRALMLRVLREINSCPGTHAEIALRMRLKPDQVWKRISDLRRKKMVEDSGVTRPGPSGRWQIVWKVTPPQSSTNLSSTP